MFVSEADESPCPFLSSFSDFFEDEHGDETDGHHKACEAKDFRALSLVLSLCD
jgi:hypothetical protein